jgi:hypothetical protein
VFSVFAIGRACARASVKTTAVRCYGYSVAIVYDFYERNEFNFSVPFERNAFSPGQQMIHAVVELFFFRDSCLVLLVQGTVKLIK